MRIASVIAVLSSFILFTAGCGWSPPSGNQPEPSTCSAADGPSPDTVAAEIAKVAGGQPWQETARGSTTDCALNWVQVGPAEAAASDAPSQVLFFDHGTPIGTATPEPRPYITVTTSGDTVSVQYQWRQAGEPACCPTGIGTVRFQLADGKLKALDPIPGPQS
jgi:LppP/LprE lipoprotein